VARPRHTGGRAGEPDEGNLYATVVQIEAAVVLRALDDFTFYENYFRALETEHPNFDFHLALSSPLPEDGWTGHTGFIHDVISDKYLRGHSNPKAVKYYLCSPPMMIKACTKMLAEYGIPADHIAYDEF